MIFPKEILLKIIHYTHLSWVKDNSNALETDVDIFELRNLEWHMWDHVEHMCRQLYRKKLKERTQIISNLEKKIFERMIKNCDIIETNYNLGSNDSDSSDSDWNEGTITQVTFRLTDEVGGIWKWEWEDRRLERITHVQTDDNWNNPMWLRHYNVRWGTDIETPVLRFANGSDNANNRIGLFIYSLPSRTSFGKHNKIVRGDFVDDLSVDEDFTTKPLVNMSWCV